MYCRWPAASIVYGGLQFGGAAAGVGAWFEGGGAFVGTAVRFMLLCRLSTVALALPGARMPCKALAGGAFDGGTFADEGVSAVGAADSGGGGAGNGGSARDEAAGGTGLASNG